MKVSLKWLSEYTAVPEDLKAFCDRLDLTGTGVEGVEKTGEAFEGVVVGHVLTCEPHPDSDHMHVVTVDVGAEELVQIVCGAPNIAADVKVPVALVGAVLPGDFKIKKSKLRGVVSCGMCCSRRELGLGQDHSGIWVLPDDAPVGQPMADFMGAGDTVLDLEITPNRPDCLSMVGMAREVGAMYQQPVAWPLSGDVEKLAAVTAGEDVAAAVTVEVPDAARCPRYTARVIDNVKVGPSPEWLAERVTAAGGRSINNVVDVTNYILYLYGQPLHAFDFAKVASADGCAHIIVRAAADGEHLVTLDGEDRALTEDMTVIATPERAVALAGVLAGSMRDAAWNSPAVPFDFFDAKGVLENLARELALPKVRFRALSAEEAPQLQPGRAAEMMANGAVIGWVGEIHPLAADAFGAEPPVVAFELDVAALVRACRPARDYVDVPTFPAVTVDQAFVVAEDVPHEKMVQVMTSAGGKLLESVALFDVYRDAERVGAGKKSMAYSLVYRAPDRTLTSEEVERAHGKLVSKVEKATGAEVRG